MIKGVKFVSIPVRDQDRALEFYTKKLGMRVITDSPFDDTQRWIELGIPRADTKVVLFTASGQEHLGDGCGLQGSRRKRVRVVDALMVSGSGVARRRSAFWNRLATNRQPTLNRTTWADDPLLGVFLEGLVFRALAAEPLQNRQVSLVTFVRQHRITRR